MIYLIELFKIMISFILYVKSSKFTYPMSIGIEGLIQLGGTIMCVIIKSSGFYTSYSEKYNG